MKRILTAILAALTLALAGCGQQAAGFAGSDLVLNLGGNAYRCRDNIESVFAALGDGYQYAEGKSCNYDGLDKIYSYPEAEFYTNPLAEGDLLNEIYTQSPEVTTSKGLGVGAAKADVTAAYGEPAEDAGSLLIYRLSQETGEPALCFELEDDVVTAIFLTLEAV